MTFSSRGKWTIIIASICVKHSELFKFPSIETEHFYCQCCFELKFCSSKSNADTATHRNKYI